MLDNAELLKLKAKVFMEMVKTSNKTGVPLIEIKRQLEGVLDDLGKPELSANYRFTLISRRGTEKISDNQTTLTVLMMVNHVTKLFETYNPYMIRVDRSDGSGYTYFTEFYNESKLTRF